MHEHSGRLTDPADVGDSEPEPGTSPAGGHSGWAMVACCAPMILTVLAVLFGWFGR